MWLNYLKIAWRNLLKYRFFSFLNLVGLAVGLAVALLIGLYVRHELRVNSWIPDADNIYRVYRPSADGTGGGWAHAPSVLAEELTTRFPQVRGATFLGAESDIMFAREDQALYAEQVAYVDSNFLKVIDIPLLTGDPDLALHAPHTGIISKALALRFFNRTEVIGESLNFNDEFNLTITGVYESLKGSTHLDYDVFMRPPYSMDSWLSNNFEVYVRTTGGADIRALASQITDHLKPILLQAFTQANFEVTESDLPQWDLQPLGDIHLHSQNLTAVTTATGNERYLYIFSFIGFLVLLVAAINYLNLSTARAANRAQEIGIRKVSGAQRIQLIGQFLTESVLQSLLAMLLAVPLAELLLPFFNQVSGRSLAFLSGDWMSLAGPFLGVSIGVGLMAGLYPALVLSHFKPVSVLKGETHLRNGGKYLRKSLVIAQFTGVVVLIVLVSVMYQQLRFMLDQDLGFQADQVLVIPMNYDNSWRNAADQLQRWEQQPGIISVSTASAFPGSSVPDYSLEVEGLDQRYRSPDLVFGDANYAEVLGLEVVEGRFLSEEFGSDTLQGFVVNEAFVADYGLEDPLGTQVRFPWYETWGKIIGVVKDYHYKGLDHEIQPMAIFGGPISRMQLGIRFRAEQWQEVLDFVQAEWAAVEPAHPFRYSFLQEDFGRQYAEHKHFQQTMLYSAGLTIFIAILGLFGLSTFVARQRTKEIGIRKVLGASVPELMRMLLRQFVGIALIAGLIAIPLAFWLSHRWLEDFPYRISLNAFPFLIGIILAMVITVLTVSFQSLRAARINPVESLRKE